jgi:hypothetical protein
MGVHDQRFKSLLQEFLPDFLRLFFPEQAAGLDFSGLEWLQQEMLTDPPAGGVYLIDLIARVRRRGDGSEAALATLVLLEIEARDAATETRAWLFHYYEALRRQHGLPVLPVALYLRVGLDGIGIDHYTESYGTMEVLRFSYLYVGLPALPAEQYVAGDNWIGVALSALMRVPAQRRAWLRAEALRRVYQECQENLYRRQLLGECVEAYLTLDAGQQQEFEALLRQERYQTMIPSMQTTFEKGKLEGERDGLLKGERKIVRLLLEKKFSPLPEDVLRRLEALSMERLSALALEVLEAKALSDLRFEE